MRIIVVIILFSFLHVNAQNIDYVKKIIHDLTDEDMAGRGYVNRGMEKAAHYLSREMATLKLKPFGNSYMQPFLIQVNCFPGLVKVSAEDHILESGKDFLVGAGCPDVYGTYEIIHIDSAFIDNAHKFDKLYKKKMKNKMVMLEPALLGNLIHPERYKLLTEGKIPIKGIIYIETKLMWTISTEQDKQVSIYIRKGACSDYIRSISLNIEADFVEGYACNNLAGYIPGTQYPDSYIVYTAHYDHLGKMGTNAIFPGSNDNAGGAAMLLDLAQYYQNNRPAYSVAFIFFGAEEAGLLGSFYYIQHPLFSLKSISCLINLDLVTTGDKGATIVNAMSHPAEFDQLVKLNELLNLLPDIKPRPNAANSDHYPFTQMGVRAMYMYLMGNYNWYHDIYDRYENLTLSKYEAAFKLLYQWSLTWMKP